MLIAEVWKRHEHPEELEEYVRLHWDTSTMNSEDAQVRAGSSLDPVSKSVSNRARIGSDGAVGEEA